MCRSTDADSEARIRSWHSSQVGPADPPEARRAEKATENYTWALKPVGNCPARLQTRFRSGTPLFLSRAFRGSMALLAPPFQTFGL